MSTEFNYVVNVDTSRVMGAMHEVRSQMGMAMTPTGPMGAPAGGGFGAFVGGGVSGVAAMTRAMMRFPAGNRLGLGTTFTDPAMAYSPHYGMPLAYTTPGMERMIDKHGLAAAARLRPPGVSPGDFFLEVTGNRIEREAEARRQAFVAARTTLVGGGLGLAGGMVAAPVGARIGQAIGARFGPFGAAAGRLIGGLAAFMGAEGLVSRAVQEHYADVERIGGTTRELGEIVGAGRGLTREQRYRMGRAVRQAAGDLNMDVQAVADVMAGARRTGMLPRTTNPEDLRKETRRLVQSIDESAQMLGTSMANAMRVIRGMTGMGFGAQEGVSRLIGMAGAAGVSPMAMFGVGMQGAGIARRAEMPGRMGFDLFTQGVLSAAGAGLSRRELGYVGGVTGLGAQIGMVQMGHVVSPLGDMQLMAMAGGQALPADPFATAGMAARALAQGGDPIGNIIQFEVSKRELREGLGARGAQAMTRQAIMGFANMYQQMSPNLSQEEAFRFVAMTQFGMSSTAAQGMYAGTVGGGGRGRGGGGGGGVALAEAQYNALVGSTVRRYTDRFDELGLQSIGGRIWDKVTDVASDTSTQWAAAGAGLGFLGGPKGAVIGAGIGYVGGKIYDFFAGGGLDLDLSAAQQADREFIKSAQTQDRLEARVRERHGLLPFDAAAYGRVARGRANIDTLQLDTSNVDPYGVASNYIAAQLAMAGVQPVDGPGPGTTKLAGQYYRTRDVANVGNIDEIMSDKRVDRKALEASGDWIREAQGRNFAEQRRMRRLWDEILSGEGDTNAKLEEFSRLAGEFLDEGELPEGARLPEGERGIRTATRRRILERTLGIDIAEGYRGLPESVRGRNIVGLSISAMDKDIRAMVREEIRGDLAASTYFEGMADDEKKKTLDLWVNQLSKDKQFGRLIVEASKGDPTEFVGRFAERASELGISDPEGFAQRFAGDPAFLQQIGERFGETGTDPADILGIEGGGRGRRGRRRTSTRGEGQFQGAFNPIGFGQTESALSLINTSLQKTAGMIDTLDRRVRRLSRKPSAAN